jgi:transposase
MDDAALEANLFADVCAPLSKTRFVPDWVEVHKELRRKGVTLHLLWEEYKQAHPEGLQYSQFCARYQVFRDTVDLPMRQHHKAGEKMFVDYCGQTLDFTDGSSGQTRQAQVFVAVLGASNYTYAEACFSQSLAEWVMAHAHAFSFFGGVPELIVPDNLKSGVSMTHRYEPEINKSYEEMANHYGCVVVPARVRKPKDKAKVEKGVQDVERRILAPLRHRRFFSLHEINMAIAELLTRYNEAPFQKMPGSRRSLFEQLDKPALRLLPTHAYEYAHWQKARVNIDYHVAIEGHFYSVPYQLVKQEIEVRVTTTTVECFHKNKRVASHLRSQHKGQFSTIAEHMPQKHQQYAQWTPERLVHWAKKTGPFTAAAVEHILSNRPHPQQGFRSCLGIMRLGKEYGDQRLEAACQRALALSSVNYRSLESILKKNLEKKPLTKTIPKPPTEHNNIRGPEYYREKKG